VSSLDWFVSIGLVPLSYALVGPTASVLGARTTLVVAGLLGGAVTLAFLFLPGMRDLDRQPVETATDPAADPADPIPVG
jgi:hypothetical protein